MSELKIVDTVAGEGEAVKAGDQVRVHYTGRLTDGTVFDSSHNRNEPFEFKVGAGQVIRGWDEGLIGMKKGGTSTISSSSMSKTSVAFGGIGPMPRSP